MFSDPRLTRFDSRLCSFSLDDGEQVIAFEAPATAALLAFLAAPASSPTPAARLSTFPLTAIRIETAPGSFRLVGTLGVHRSDAHPAFATPAGCWDLGYVLVPDVGGRGIATAAVRAAMAVWQEVGDDVQAFGAFGASDLLSTRAPPNHSLTQPRLPPSPSRDRQPVVAPRPREARLPRRRRV